MGGHPTVTVVPALLALGEQIGATGRLFIESFVAGYETSGRVGRLVSPSHYQKGFHVTGTVGSFSATAAAGRMLGLSDKQLAVAFGIAATQAAGLKSNFGTMCKPLHAGTASEHGLRAARLAAKGFTARGNSLECDQGFASSQSDHLNAEAALGEPPAGWHLRNNLFKYHAACYLTHAPIECAKEIRLKSNFPPERVKKILLRIDAGADKVCNIENPTTGLEAKFSLRQTVAMALTGVDTANLNSYNDAVTQEPRIKALARQDVDRVQAQLGAFAGRDGDPARRRHDAGGDARFGHPVGRRRQAAPGARDQVRKPGDAGAGRRRHQAPARRHRAHRQPRRCRRTRARVGEELDGDGMTEDFRTRARPMPKGNRYEDFEPGRVFQHHWGRTITESESTLFSTLTLHFNPHYFNAAYARAHGHPASSPIRCWSSPPCSASPSRI